MKVMDDSRWQPGERAAADGPWPAALPRGDADTWWAQHASSRPGRSERWRPPSPRRSQAAPGARQTEV